MFYVTVENNGVKFWLGGTVWRFAEVRAQKFDNEMDAHKALIKAKPFMSYKIYKKAVIEAVS